MNTPKTDAVRGMGRVSIQDFYEMYDHARQLETQVQELRLALQTIYMKTIDIDSRETARAILEKTK